MFPEGEQRPQHAHPPYPGTVAIMYHKALQQLLTGPEPDVCGGAGVDAGYRKQTPCGPAVIVSAQGYRLPRPHFTETETQRAKGLPVTNRGEIESQASGFQVLAATLPASPSEEGVL